MRLRRSGPRLPGYERHDGLGNGRNPCGEIRTFIFPDQGISPSKFPVTNHSLWIWIRSILLLARNIRVFRGRGLSPSSTTPRSKRHADYFSSSQRRRFPRREYQRGGATTPASPVSAVNQVPKSKVRRQSRFLFQKKRSLTSLNYD